MPPTVPSPPRPPPQRRRSPPRSPAARPAAAVAEAEQIVAEAAASLNVEVASAASSAAVPGVTLASATTSATATSTSGFLTALVPGTASVGPIPPRTPPVFPLYTSAQQTAASVWLGSLPTRGPNFGTPDDRAYQVRIAGPTEYRMASADGQTTVWADGFRPDDGAIIDAKHVRELGCSPRTLDRLHQGDTFSTLISDGDKRELSKYDDALNNPTSHAQFVEIDTNDPQTTGYWQFLCAEQHVKSDVRYAP